MTINGRDRGATLPIVALLLPILILMTAFAVDLGRQRSSRRTMQARADIIALDLVRLTDGRTHDLVVSGDATHDSADVARIASAGRNDVEPSKITVRWGTFSPASGFIPTVATGIPNTVEVTAAETTDYFFQPGDGATSRKAIASTGNEPLAGFTIGSFGASLSSANAGLLNSLLTPLLGSPAGLNALSYQGLATGTVGIADIGAELGLLTGDEVLNTDVTSAQLLQATARALRRNSTDPTAQANANLLDAIAATSSVQNMRDVQLGQLVSAATGSEDAAVAGSVDLLDVVQAVALLSTCTDPNDISTCAGIALPNISTSLPLADLSGEARIVQGQAYAYGPALTTTARNSQATVSFTAELDSQNVGKCVPASILDLHCVLGGLLGAVSFVDATVILTATVRLADGRGTISAIGCGTPLTLDLLTTTGAYDVDVDARSPSASGACSAACSAPPSAA